MMNRYNFLNCFLIFICCISLHFEDVSSNQESLPLETEEKLQNFQDNTNHLLDSVNQHTNDKLLDNDHQFSFDSSILYKINWQKRPNDFELDEKNQSIVTLTASDLNHYHCVLPEIAKEQQSPKENANLDPYSKILPLFSKKICIYNFDLYWTYEICLNDRIRQFNGDILERKHTQEYFLGHFSADNLERDRQAYNQRALELKSQNKALSKIEFNGNRVPFIYVTMTKGTICDLNGKPRQTVIYFVCDHVHDKLHLESFEEVQSCEYEAIVSTSLLCDHPDFAGKKENELQINCFPHQNDAQPLKPVGEEQYETKHKQMDSLSQQIREMTGIAGLKFDSELQNTKILKIEKPNFMMDNFEPIDQSLDKFINGEQCFLSFFRSYWKYDFCFQKPMEMYRIEKGVRTKTISLGKFDKEKHLNWLEMNPSKRKNSEEMNYLLSDGDICHETNTLRKVQVKLKCTSKKTLPFTLTLDEPVMCEYILTFESTMVCELLNKVDSNGLVN